MAMGQCAACANSCQARSCDPFMFLSRPEHNRRSYQGHDQIHHKLQGCNSCMYDVDLEHLSRENIASQDNTINFLHFQHQLTSKKHLNINQTFYFLLQKLAIYACLSCTSHNITITFIHPKMYHLEPELGIVYV